MKYAIIVYETPDESAARTDAARAGEYWGAYTAYSMAIREAKVDTGGTALQTPDLATTLRVRDGRRDVQDGPYADTKEQLGGIFIIDVPDLDAALAWAARCPAATTGAVEVRPILEMGPPQ